MNLENQVISLDIAIKLKVINVPQKSYFYWGENPIDIFNLYIDHMPACNIMSEYCAFTAAELLALLPKYIEIIHGCRFDEEIPTYLIKYQNEKIVDESDTNIANACARAVIYFIENKLIEA